MSHCFRPRPQPRLFLEQLEQRDCPAAPSLTLNVSMLSQNMVELSGIVTDEAPDQATLQFTGVASGTVTPDANGAYSFTATASALGTVYAQAFDIEDLSSEPVEGQVTSNAPQINNFKAIEQQERSWLFQGQVADENPAGLTVTLGGLPSLNGKTTVVDANGDFSMTITLAPGENGTATASTVDWWGLTSDQVQDDVQQSNPVSFDLPQVDSYPHRIVAGAGNFLFFTETVANRIGRIDVNTGEVLEVDVPTASSSPLDLTFGNDGFVYFTEHLGDKIGKLDPDTLQIVDEFELPTGTHPNNIAVGLDGDLLFTMSTGIGRLNPATEYFTSYPIQSGAYGFLDLVVDDYGDVWFTQITPSGGAVNWLDLDTGNTLQYDLSPASIPSGIAIGPDSNLWVTDVLGDNGDSIWRVTTSGVVTEFHTPTAWSGPQHITAAPDGYLYATEYYIGKLVRIDPSDGSMTEIDVPTPYNGAFDITVGPYGQSLWFTQASANLIGSYLLETSMLQMSASSLSNSLNVGGDAVAEQPLVTALDYGRTIMTDSRDGQSNFARAFSDSESPTDKRPIGGQATVQIRRDVSVHIADLEEWQFDRDFSEDLLKEQARSRKVNRVNIDDLFASCFEGKEFDS